MSTPEVSSGARRRAWAWNAGLFLGALSWLFAGPLTLVPAGLLGFGLWCAAAALLVLGTPAPPAAAAESGPRHRHRSRAPAAAALLLAAAAGARAALLAPAPYAWTLLFALAAGVLLVLGRAPRLARRAGPAALLLLLQAALSLPVLRFALAQQPIALLAEAAAPLLQVLGIDAAASGGTLVIFHEGELYGFLPTAGKTALAFFVLYGGGACLARWLLPRAPSPALLPLLLVSLLYFAVRFAFLSFYSVTLHGYVPYATETLPLFLSLLPLLLLLQRFAAERVPPAGPPARARPRAAAAAAAVAGAALAWALAGFDPGVPKGGRLLIDNAHGDWESTEVAFDREYFGTHSVYAYSELKRVLGHYFEVEVWNEGELTPAVLGRFDVALLKTPIVPYRPAEVDAVEGFVRGGGGLLLLGDHTNFLGMNTYLTSIAQRAGIAFRPDQTFRTGETLFRYEAPAPVWRHPAALAVDRFLTMTGCSFSTWGLGAGTVLLEDQLVAESADYSHGSFFGPAGVDGWDVLGPQRLAAAAHLGDGRVVALGDSTIFSSFTLHDEGRRELLLGAAAYLNRSNRLPGFVPALAGALGLLAALGVLVILGAGSGRELGPVLVAFPAALGLAVLGLGAWKAAAYAPPEPHEPLPWANVYARSRAREGTAGDRYVSAFVALARAGYVPRWVAAPGDGLEDAEAVVLFEPGAALDEEAGHRLQDYLADGGRVLAVTGGESPALQHHFGVHVRPAFAAAEARALERGSPFRSEVGPLLLLDVARRWEWGEGAGGFEETEELGSLRLPVPSVEGGTPLVRVGDATVAARVGRGAGVLVVTTVAGALSDASLGDPMWTTQPKGVRQAQYDFLFRLVDALADDVAGAESSDAHDDHASH